MIRVVGRRFIIIGIIGLVTGGILHFLSYPTKKEIAAWQDIDRVLMEIYSDPDPMFRDLKKYKELSEKDKDYTNYRKPKYTTGSYIAYGVGGLFFLIGIAIGPEKKAADKEEKAS